MLLLFVLFTGWLLGARYQWFSSPSHEQAARSSAQTPTREDEQSTESKQASTKRLPGRRLSQGFLS